MNMTWNPPGFSSTDAPDGIAIPAGSSRIRITPSVTLISWISTRPAPLYGGCEQASGSDPLFSIFR